MEKILIKNDLVEIDLPKSLKKAKKVKKQLEKKIEKETIVLVNVAKKELEVEKQIKNCENKIKDFHEYAVKEAKIFNDAMARNLLDLEKTEKNNLTSLQASLGGLKAKYRAGVDIVRKLNDLRDKTATDIKRYLSEIENNAYCNLVNATKPVMIKKKIDTSTRVPELIKEVPESKYLANEAINRVFKDLKAIKKVDKDHEDKEVAALRKEGNNHEKN